MFSSYEMVEDIGTLLDPDFSNRSKWDADQWEAYCRIVLLTLRDYVEKGMGAHSYVIYRALGHIKEAVSDLYKLNGVADSPWKNDTQARLRAVVDFVQEAVGILEKKGIPSRLQRRVNNKDRSRARTVYDHIAKLVYEVIFAASAVTSPRDPCWWIQHNSVWGELFNFDRLEGPAGAVVKFKVCRLLYQDVIKMKSFPNFKGARILAYCLNVMGLERREGDYDRDSRALHQAILLWAKRNYAWLYAENPRVAGACLVDGMTWDAKSQRIVLTYPADGLRRAPAYVYLDVDPPPVQAGTKRAAPGRVATLRRRIKRLRTWESGRNVWGESGPFPPSSTRG
jgi:hypothetical protein